MLRITGHLSHEIQSRDTYQVKLRHVRLGSRARGSHGPESDADVAVLLKGPPGSFLATKLDLADIAYDVLLETGIRIQPLPIWQNEWDHPEAYSNPRLLYNIDREGIRL